MASAKELRPILTEALRSGFLERGWEPPRRGTGVFRRPVPDTELVVEWEPEVEGYKYGGLRFGGSGAVAAPSLVDELLTYPDDVWETEEDRRDAATSRWHPSIASTSAGFLIDPRGSYRAWTVQSVDAVTSSADAFFQMVDGPMEEWIASVTPVGALLDWALRGRGISLLGVTGAELLALLALRRDRPAVAQAVMGLAKAKDRSGGLDAFERELALRHHDALERAGAGLPKDHELWRPLADALWTGFAARGWSPSSAGPGTFELDPANDGLVVRWSPDVEAEAGGGLRFGGVGILTAPGVTAELMTFPDGTRPWAFDGLDRSGVEHAAWLEVVTAGRLIDPDGDEPLWTVRSREQVDAAAAAFFTMVDGPLADWIRVTASIDAQLRAAAAATRQRRPSRVRHELLVLLALARDRGEDARAIVRAGIGNIRDPIGRFARFENELAARSAIYGQKQVHAGDNGVWLIDRPASGLARS